MKKKPAYIDPLLVRVPLPSWLTCVTCKTVVCHMVLSPLRCLVVGTYIDGGGDVVVTSVAADVSREATIGQAPHDVSRCP